MKALNGTGFKKDVHRLGRGVRTLKTDVDGVAHDAAHAARSGVSELRRGADRAVEAARNTAAGAAESFRGVISHNPVASVGIAAGVGVIVGLMISFRRR